MTCFNNFIIEERAAEGRAERFAEHAAELVASQVDAAVGTDSQAIQALKEKTSTIPIVMLGAADPIGSGFIASLARPGGNITGVTNQQVATIASLKNPSLVRSLILYEPSVNVLAPDSPEGKAAREDRAKILGPAVAANKAGDATRSARLLHEGVFQLPPGGYDNEPTNPANNSP